MNERPHSPDAVPQEAVLTASESEVDSTEGGRRRFGPQEDASILYRRTAKPRITRTFSESAGSNGTRPRHFLQDGSVRPRRLSHDENPGKPRRFLVDVEATMNELLRQEDTDNNQQIAASDQGPKVFTLGTASSNGYNSFEIRGTYMLSNLLQELALARDHGQTSIVLDEARLCENPVSRLSRMIRHSFWVNLTRRIDADGLEAICADPKNHGKNQAPRIYVPEDEVAMRKYYERVAVERPNLRLTVETLPKNWDAAWVKDRNEFPGILALAMKEVKLDDGTSDLVGIPFVVPGARFNECYNWDSYFIALGLLSDGLVDLAQGIVSHFEFEIKHYGKILNGNRSYYLCRSQPPFLTDLTLKVYEQLNPLNEIENKAWLRRAIQSSIREYHTVWMASPRLDRISGLSRYRPDGLGIPPETEASHFTSVLQPYADKLGISVNEFIEKYNAGEVQEPALDEYFLHDRAVRESGHDTTYRFEKRCANLGTIDLCSLLYKYEMDIATTIRDHFNDDLELIDDFTLSSFPFDDQSAPTAFKDEWLPVWAEPARPSTSTKQTSAEWFARAARRKELADHHLWHEGHGIYYDYETVKKRQSCYDSVTTFWAMWAGMASPAQAERMMKVSLPKFEVMGGLLSGTETSRGRISLQRPNRQWDYPAAWPPHQILAWAGFASYGYVREARRVAYRWLYMVTTGFVEAGGVVPEKFNAIEASANIDAEYGNQGTDFHHIPREGFGWTNASYQVGLQVLTSAQKKALGALSHPDSLFNGVGL